MASYVGCCGSCVYCDLTDSYKSLGGIKFKCTRSNYYVKADEEACNRFEPDRNRSTAIIDKYNS